MTDLFNAIATHARHQPSALALSDGTRVLPWRDLPAEIDRVVSQILLCCPNPGPVAFILPNGMSWVIVDLALMRLGRTSLPLSPFFTPDQIARAVEESGCAYLLSSRTPAGLAAGVLSVLEDAVFVTAIRIRGERCLVPPDGTAKITYRVSEDGLLRGTFLPQATLETLALSVIERLGPSYAKLHCALIPLPVLLENVAGLYATLLAGGRYHVPPPQEVGLREPFLPVFSRLVETLANCGASSAIMVPRLLRGSMAALKRTGITLPTLETLMVGGAPLASALYSEARALALPVILVSGFED